MGTFYNPPSDVVDGKVGRQLTVPIDDSVVWDHGMLMARLVPGEHLFVCLDNGSWKACGLVDNPREFEAAMRSYDQGMGNWLSRECYAITDAEMEGHT